MSKKVLKLVVLIVGVILLFGGRSYANMDGKNNSGRAPLHLACERDDLELVKMLVKAGAEVNARDNDGNIPLHLACRTNDLELVQILIDKGSDINKKNNSGDTPLHIACEYIYVNDINNSRKEIIEVLIKTGANINAKNNYGDIPLHIACKYIYPIDKRDRKEITETLLYNGKQRKEIIELLLSNGTNVNEKNNSGNTALHVWFSNKYANGKYSWTIGIGSNSGLELYRSSKGMLFSDFNRLRKEVAELLLKNGADITLKNNKDYTVLDSLFTTLYNEKESICNYGYWERDVNKIYVSYLVNEVEFLLEKGAVSNTAKDKDGNDLLSFACKYGYNNIVKLLVDK